MQFAAWEFPVMGRSLALNELQKNARTGLAAHEHESVGTPVAHTVKSLAVIVTALMGEVESLQMRIASLENSVALPLPGASVPVSSKTVAGREPTNPMKGLLVRLGDFPDFESVDLTFDQAKARLDAWAELFRGVPQPKQVKCVHCEVGHHETSAEVRACWQRRVGQ